MNVNLNCEFQAVEVQWALQQMDPLRAPGPYGMSPIFYKSFWHIVGEDVSATVLATLNGGIVPDAINSTFTSLILFLILDILAFVTYFINSLLRS